MRKPRTPLAANAASTESPRPSTSLRARGAVPSSTTMRSPAAASGPRAADLRHYRRSREGDATLAVAWISIGPLDVAFHKRAPGNFFPGALPFPCQVWPRFLGRSPRLGDRGACGRPGTDTRDRASCDPAFTLSPALLTSSRSFSFSAAKSSDAARYECGLTGSGMHRWRSSRLPSRAERLTRKTQYIWRPSIVSIETVDRAAKIEPPLGVSYGYAACTDTPRATNAVTTGRAVEVAPWPRRSCGRSR